MPASRVPASGTPALKGVFCINLCIYSNVSREKQLWDPPVYPGATKEEQTPETPKGALTHSPQFYLLQGTDHQLQGLDSGLWTPALHISMLLVALIVC